jgi:hypothetical protein
LLQIQSEDRDIRFPIAKTSICRTLSGNSERCHEGEKWAENARRSSNFHGIFSARAGIRVIR